MNAAQLWVHYHYLWRTYTSVTTTSRGNRTSVADLAQGLTRSKPANLRQARSGTVISRVAPACRTPSPAFDSC